jgi:hypothetical protein
MNSVLPEPKILDLSKQLKDEIMRILNHAFENNKSEKAMAELIRSRLEEKDEGKWNVILGKDFGTHVSHKSGKYGLFQMGELNVLLWQTG